MQANKAVSDAHPTFVPVDTPPIVPTFSAFTDCPNHVRIPPPLPFPSSVPSTLAPPQPFTEPVFDPAIHLAMEEPEQVTLLDFTTAKTTPAVKGNENSSLAYTSAFRLLSDEGVKALRSVLSHLSYLTKSSARTPAYIRGAAYPSKFLRDLNECPLILERLSKYAGMPIVPHYMQMNYAHTNYGHLPTPGAPPRPVDQWHADSVHFVMIIIGSDMEGMVGGELQCVRRKGRAEGFQLIAETNNNVAAEDLLNVNYEKMGYALFMQGSDIVHHVTPVLQAKEARITVVNSYMPANVFAIDRTVYSTFVHSPKDAEWEAAYEFVRGRAHRAQHQLAHIVDNTQFTTDTRSLTADLRRVIAELQQTVDLVEFKATDFMDYYHEIQDGGVTVGKRLHQNTANGDANGDAASTTS